MGSRILSSVARRLEGKVALITGGASGIGESTARLFSHHGAKVVIADVQDKLGHLLCKDLGSTSGASFVHCDVTHELDVQKAVEMAVTKHGKLDIMMNNAGTVIKEHRSILENQKEDFEKILAVNVTGVFLGMKHAARVMIPARQGSIISTASVCSIVGGIASHSYTCSKHAVAGLTKNTAAELGRFGIRVNCVSPYVVDTPLAKNFLGYEGDDELASYYSNLGGRPLRAQDVAEAALFLGSDESVYVSGHNLVVDGGFSTGLPSFGAK